MAAPAEGSARVADMEEVDKERAAVDERRRRLTDGLTGAVALFKVIISAVADASIQFSALLQFN